MKPWKRIGFLSLLLVVMANPILAAGGQDLDTSYLDFSGADVLLTEDGNNFLQEQTGKQTLTELLEAVLRGEETFTFSGFIKAFGASLGGNIQAFLSLILQVAALALLSQFFYALDIHWENGSAANAGFLALYGILVLVLMKSFQIAYEETRLLISRIQTLSLYMMPAMAAVTVAGGRALSGIFQHEMMTAGFALILTALKNIFAAAVLWVTVIETVNLISRRAVLSQLSGLTRTLIEKGMKLLTALYLLWMGLSSLVAPAADKVVYKASSAVLSSVPVVGSAMAGAMDSVLAGSMMVKNGIGAAGCIALLCLCLWPAAKLAAIWLIYRLLAAFLSPVADERIIKLLTAMGRSAAQLLAIIVCGVVVFTGAVGIFIMSTS